MGVFTVIQKSRHHVSNLYDAPMPYMQRITWSGSALHEGPLPGYPASHGCVRLTTSFAQLLWKTTKMGARVIVTRPEVAPVEIEHARLFVPRPKMVEAPKLAGPSRTASPIRNRRRRRPWPRSTADAASATAVAATSLVGDASKPVVTSSRRDRSQCARSRAAHQACAHRRTTRSTTTAADAAVETKPAAELQPAAQLAAPAPIIVDERPKAMPAAIVQEANGRPISVFVSLKEGKLYVRQGWKPLFDAPVTLRAARPADRHPCLYRDGHEGRRQRPALDRGVDPEQHQARRPSSRTSGRKAAQRPARRRPSRSRAAAERGRGARSHRHAAGAVERISELITPGSSLIVSDNKLSDETGEYTDFIVLTRVDARHTPATGLRAPQAATASAAAASPSNRASAPASC